MSLTLAALTAEPLPLPLATWGVRDAIDALDEARLDLPFRLAAPLVVSALSTVVLRCGPHAVKVYPPGTDPAHLSRTATALAGSASALLPVVEPIVTSAGVVSVQPWLRSTRPVGWGSTGALLRTFHAEHADADVAPWQPLRRLDTQVVGLSEEDAAVLLTARAELRTALAVLHSPLGIGAVHGDLSPANVMRRRDGAVLIDLDFVALAPREYDLSSAARRFDAGEISASAYGAFCRAYGSDVRSWEGRGVLDAVAELGGVAFRLWHDRHRDLPLDWLPGVIRRWRTAL